MSMQADAGWLALADELEAARKAYLDKMSEGPKGEVEKQALRNLPWDNKATFIFALRAGQDTAHSIERYRHIKRGFTYRVIGRGRMQVDGDMDDERMVIYQSEIDGQIWCRPAYEFDDPKRFERVDFPDVERCRVCERDIDFRILKDCHPIRRDCVFQERARRS